MLIEQPGQGSGTARRDLSDVGGPDAEPLAQVAGALIVALPLYYIVVNTFKTQAEMSSSPVALPTQLFLDD